MDNPPAETPKRRPYRTLKGALRHPLAEVDFKPTPEMIDFLTARIRDPQPPLRTTAQSLDIKADKVFGWFQDEAFLEWYAERMERSDQFWADEILGQVRAGALKGEDFRLMKYFLEHRHKRIMKHNERAAAAKMPGLVQVNVAIIQPRDPAVQAREREIAEAKIVDVTPQAP